MKDKKDKKRKKKVVAVIVAIFTMLIVFFGMRVVAFTNQLRAEHYKDLVEELQDEKKCLKDKERTVYMERLVVGTKSAQVKTLQRLLNELGYTDSEGEKLEVNGVFDERVESAVIKAQKDLDVKLKHGAYGVCSKKTWDKLLNAS